MELFKYRVSFKDPTDVADVVHHEYGVVAGNDFDGCARGLVEYYAKYCFLLSMTIEVLEDEEDDDNLNHGVCPSRCFPHE